MQYNAKYEEASTHQIMALIEVQTLLNMIQRSLKH